MIDTKKFLENYNTNKNDPNWLADTVVKLASELFTFSTEVASAELDEKEALVKLLEPQPTKDKEGNTTFKAMSVAQAENTAVVQTLNLYGQKKLNLEAGYEMLNALKTRIKVLMNERENT